MTDILEIPSEGTEILGSVIVDTASSSGRSTSQDKYVILMETNGEECESWYYFIKFNGNEAALGYIDQQLEQIEMYILDDYSTFDLDLEHLVSAQTAKEMTQVELNSVTFHRKFDGKMKMINLGLKKRDSNEKRLKKAHKAMAMGKIEEYVDDEDIDEADLVSDSDESEHEEEDDLVPQPFPGEAAALGVPPPVAIPGRSLQTGHAIGAVATTLRKRKKKKR